MSEQPTTPEPSALPPSLAERGESHPEADLIAGWLEGNLLPAEATRVERHLSGCELCRSLCSDEFEDTGSRVQPNPFESSSNEATATERKSEAQRRRFGAWPYGFMGLAAALLIAFGLVNRLSPPGSSNLPGLLALDMAGQSQELFSELRSIRTPLAQEFFVGLQLESQSNVRLLAVTPEGKLLPIPLDPTGALSLKLAADKQHSFGPYPTTQDTRPLFVVAIASEEVLSEQWLEACGPTQVLSEADLAQLKESIQGEHEASVLTYRP